MNGYGPQYRFGRFYLPTQRTVRRIQAIDVTVSRTEHHDALADSRSTHNALAGSKAPQFLAVLQGISSQTTQIIAHKDFILFYGWRTIDTDTCLYHPLFFSLGVLLVHGEVRIFLGFSLTVVVLFRQRE